MMSEKEVELLKKRYYQKIKELIRISLGLGINITSPSKLKDSLKM